MIGRSTLVGKPVAQLLLNQNCTVTVAHSKTRDLPAVVRGADIVVAAIGRPEMVRGDWIKPGATVIDVGMNRIPAPERGEGKTRLAGDVAYAEAAAVAGAITPVPGGVGPMTIAMLMANTLSAACRSVGRRPRRSELAVFELFRRLFGRQVHCKVDRKTECQHAERAHPRIASVRSEPNEAEPE